ncbi:uncharacterized protein [Physcomitrium patens]|uniref:Uncharacterized protein n=1 Tax=Physcomitrium patens TaxID=3218 RepID=A9SID7_PHYPA|nr:hypothetical protein PHYPA_021196 [Physcomitrium patens]
MAARSRWSSSRLTSSRALSSSRSGSLSPSSFKSARVLARLALDAFKFSVAGGEIEQEGDYYVHLNSELGDRRYRRLCDDAGLALKEIHYCQEGLDIARVNQEQEILSQEQVTSIAPVKDLINHDYLILVIEAGEPSAEALYIKAHKLGGDKAGIHITHVPSSVIDAVLHEGVRCFTIDCDRGEKKRMQLEALLAILKKENPNYSLINANCWDYAKNTAKSLVRGCVEVNSISAAEKSRLQKEHDNLEAQLAFRHIHNTATSLIRRVASSRISTSSSVRDSARVLSSSRALELVLPLTSLASPDSDQELRSNSSVILESSRVLSSSRAVESFSHVSSPGGLAAPALSPREILDLSSPTILDSSRVLNSSEALDSSKPVELLAASTAPPPVVSSGKLWFQIFFLIFWLIIDWLGLRPWAIRVLGLRSTR